jgi:hypothetical protein
MIEQLSGTSPSAIAELDTGHRMNPNARGLRNYAVASG